MLQFEKRFSNKWMLAGSYSLSKNTELDFITSWSVKGQDPNYQLNSTWDGKIVAYPFHNFKLYGTFVLPWGFMVSPKLIITSGLRWTRYVIAPVLGNPNINIEKPGSNQEPPGINLDLRIEKDVTFGQGYRAGLYLDLYNALNIGRAEEIEGRIDSPYFGKATFFNAGRMFKLGVRIYF